MPDFKSILSRSLQPNLPASSPPPWSTSMVLIVRQSTSTVCNSYIPSPAMPPLSHPFPSLSSLEARPQSSIGDNTSLLISLSPRVMLIAFLSTNAVVDSIVVPKYCRAPNTSFPEILIRPHHFRRSSFSTSPICVAEIARLRKGL